MPTISAANNLTIQAEANNWSLLNGTSDSAAPIVQANSIGLNYLAAFAAARRLAPEGLPATQISTIVVGWAIEDTSWHLGVMVTQDVAQGRGGRWCGLARWPGEESQESARQAGELLAATLRKPFRLVPPTASPTPTSPSPSLHSLSDTAAKPAVQQVAAPPVPDTVSISQRVRPVPPPPPPETLPETEHLQAPPLMPLPIGVGEWNLEESDIGLIWERSRGWRRHTVLNAALFFGLMLVFGALSVGAILTSYAPVQPAVLPLLGLGLTLLMMALGLRQLWALMRAAVVVIDNIQRMVRVLLGYKERSGKASRTIVQSPYEGLEYVLVSHVLSRQDAPRKANSDGIRMDRIWGEVWVHLYSPRRGFVQVCYTGQLEGRIQAGLTFTERRPLDLNEVDTPAHHAALYMSEMIGIPAFVEGR